MKKGKYQSRSPRQEEQELEQAFQQMTMAANGKNAKKSPAPKKGRFEKAPAASRSQKAAGSASSNNKNKKIILICVSVVAALFVLAVGIGVWFFLSTTADNGLIMDNTYALGINIGGMTPEEAKQALHKATDRTYSQEDMVITLPDGELRLTPQDTRAALDVDRLVDDAFLHGREGSRTQRAAAMAAAALSKRKIDVLTYMTLDTGYIREAIDGFHSAHVQELVEASVKVEGARPTATLPEGARPPEDADPSELIDPTKKVHQTITITLGQEGRDFDADALYEQVMDAYVNNRFDPISAEYELTQPQPFDLEALCKEHNTDPVDAPIDPETFEVKDEIWGYGFDKAEAEALLRTAAPGEKVTLSLHYRKPTITKPEAESTLFQDVLASAKTEYYYHPERTNNLTLACKAINNYIVKPGEIFSFNETLGERTAEKGYQPAGAYVNGETVDQLGGGICQVASTIYYCSLYADLEIVERSEHMFTADYLPLGMDATVNWGTLDYRFRNNTGAPIRIEAKTEDGYVYVTLYGTDNKSYYVEMDFVILETIDWETVDKKMKEDNEKGYKDGEVIQYGWTGYIVDTYKYKYDKETDAFISKTYESHSEYDKRDKLICKIDKPTEATTIPTEETTLPPEETSEPTETTAPPDEGGENGGSEAGSESGETSGDSGEIVG